MISQSYNSRNNSVNLLSVTPSLKESYSPAKLKELDFLLYEQLDFFSHQKGVCYASNTALLRALPQLTPKTLRTALLRLEQAKLIARTVITKRSGGSLRFVITRNSHHIFCAKQRSFGNINVAELTEFYFQSPDSPKKIDLDPRFRFSLVHAKYQITTEKYVSPERPMGSSPQVSVSHACEENSPKNQDLGAPYRISGRDYKKEETYSEKAPEVKAPSQPPIVVLSSLEKNLRCSLSKEKIPEALAIWSTIPPSRKKSIRKPAAYLTHLIRIGVCAASLCAGAFSLDAMGSTKTPFAAEMDLRKIASEFVEYCQGNKPECVIVDTSPTVLILYAQGAASSECYDQISFDASPVHFWEELGAVSAKYHLLEAYNKLKLLHLNL